MLCRSVIVLLPYLDGARGLVQLVLSATKDDHGR